MLQARGIHFFSGMLPAAGTLGCAALYQSGRPGLFRLSGRRTTPLSRILSLLRLAGQAAFLVLPNTALAGALLSTLCYAWGCCWVYKTGVECCGKRRRRTRCCSLSLFPYSFFFGTVMTEGLFLLTTSAACYCALRHKWAAYAVWGCLSAMTRMTGFLVLVPAAVELLKTVQPLRPPAGQSLRAAWKALDRKIPLLLCPLLGTLSICC